MYSPVRRRSFDVDSRTAARVCHPRTGQSVIKGESRLLTAAPIPLEVNRPFTWAQGASIHPVNLIIIYGAYSRDNVLTVARSSTFDLLTLITRASPPKSICEFLLPLLDLDMSIPAAKTQSELSTVGPQSCPTPIETQLTSPLESTDTAQTPPSVGPGAYDDTVVPPFHGTARTLVLCFDGTGDQFDEDVCEYSLICGSHVSLVNLSPLCICRIRISCSSSRCSRRMIRASSWSTIRSADALFSV